VGSEHALHLVNNTLVDQLPGGGIWLRAAQGTGTVRLINNLLVGRQRFNDVESWEQRNNFVVDWDEFVRASREDFRLKPESKLRGRLVDAGVAGALPLALAREYRHPHRSVALTEAARNPGAFQG